MKKPKAQKNIVEEGFELRFHARSTRKASLQIPLEVWDSLQKAAGHRDMSVQALMKFYIGQGLRQDLSQFFGEHLLKTTAQVLTRHLHSEEEVSAILAEIKGEAVA